jgi:hypothetical protein
VGFKWQTDWLIRESTCRRNERLVPIDDDTFANLEWLQYKRGAEKGAAPGDVELAASTRAGQPKSSSVIRAT